MVGHGVFVRANVVRRSFSVLWGYELILVPRDRDALNASNRQSFSDVWTLSILRWVLLDWSHVWLGGFHLTVRSCYRRSSSAVSASLSTTSSSIVLFPVLFCFLEWLLARCEDAVIWFRQQVQRFFFHPLLCSDIVIEFLMRLPHLFGRLNCERGVNLHWSCLLVVGDKVRNLHFEVVLM